MKRRLGIVIVGLGLVGAILYGWLTWSTDPGSPIAITNGEASADDLNCTISDLVEDDFPSGFIPEGAIGVRVCSSTFQVVDDDGITTIPDLTDRIGTAKIADDLTRLANNSPANTSDRPCNAAAETTASLLFVYSDGSGRLVTVDSSDCGGFKFGNKDRFHRGDEPEGERAISILEDYFFPE